MIEWQYTDETLAQDIAGLAQSLLDDPFTGRIIRNFSATEELPDDEESIITVTVY